MNHKHPHPSKNVPHPPHPTATPSPRTVSRRFVWTVYLVLLVLPWFLLLKHPSHDPQTPAPPAPPAASFPTRVVSCAAGPWGDLVRTRIAIEPPESFIEVAAPGQAGACWTFPGAKDQALATLKTCGLTSAQLETLASGARWETVTNGVRVRPAEDLVLGLAPEARARLYTTLNRLPDNPPQNFPFAFRFEHMAERLEGAHLSEPTQRLFRQLLYQHGPWTFFSDLQILMPKLPDDQERRRFLKMIYRRYTYLVRLQISPQTEVAHLQNYWGCGGRAKDIGPLLESLTRVPEGCMIDVVHLMPPLARKLVYTYPFPADDHPGMPRRNCHWTAFNFFRDQPDDRFLQGVFARQTVEADYRKIEPAQARLGDVLFIMTEKHLAIHSANYIADDLVFTKNGSTFEQPWIYMRLPDLLDYYAAFFPPEEKLHLEFYRKKEE